MRRKGEPKMGDYSSFILIFFVLGGLGLALFLSARMTKRAIGRVIEIFQKQNAIGAQRAKTVDELGLTPPNLMARFTRMRDYRQNALSILIKTGIIQTNEEGKLFLTEEKLGELISKGIAKRVA
jgi:hypothetical protein